MQERSSPIPSPFPDPAAEEILSLFHLLGGEMQGIPARYRDIVFRKLKARATQNGGPTSVAGLITTAFMDGWMENP